MNSTQPTLAALPKNLTVPVQSSPSPCASRGERVGRGDGFGSSKVKTTFLAILTLLLTSTHLQAQEAKPAKAKPVNLVVQAEPRQTLWGFGCSQVGRGSVPEAVQAELCDRVFGELKMNVLRLWVESGGKSDLAEMQQSFLKSYPDTRRFVEDVRRRGVDTLLLAPARGEGRPKEPMPEYAHKLAEFIAFLRTKLGVEIQATGIANEPQGFTPAQAAECVRALRSELDGRGLRNVGIVAPESASADELALQLIRAIKADPIAWAGLRGIATHSYNMAATPQFTEIIAGTGKEYWQTEAGDNGNESPADANRAATAAARFLNDLNQGVTHWIWFIGFHDSLDMTQDRDNATKLMIYDRRQQRIVPHLKYGWFRQLRAAFPNGSRLHPLRAEPGGSLVYSYGKKPALNAAAAQRPDGGWSLGAVNLTGVGPNTEIAQYHPATPLAVTWEVPALAAIPELTFTVARSSATERFAPAGQVVMRAGRLTLEIAACELITLTTNPGLPEDAKR